MRLYEVLAAVLLIAVPAPGEAAPVFDSHVHLWHGETSLRDYDEQVKKAHLELAGAGVMWFGGPNEVLAGDPAAVRAGNDGIIALAAAHPGLMPIATVHPYDGEATVSELARVAGKGIRVLKLHPHTQKFDPSDPRVLTLVRKAGDLGVIVLFDNASILPGDCEKLFNLAIAAPKTKFIFAHLGGMNFRFWNILKLARTAEGFFADNIYFDVSAIVTLVAGSPLAPEFVWTMRNVGIDHILLGSDFPQFSLAQNVAALDRLGLDESERAAVTLGNAQRLFHLAIPGAQRP